MVDLHWTWEREECAGAPVFQARVTYPRATGCCLETDAQVFEGETIRLSYPAEWPRRGMVTWVGDGEFACSYFSRMSQPEISSMPENVAFLIVNRSLSKLRLRDTKKQLRPLHVRTPKVNLWPLTDDDLSN